VLVVRLGDERQPSAWLEGVVLQSIQPVLNAGDLDHAEPWIVVRPDELLRGRVAKTQSVAGPLEPEPKPLLRPIRHAPRTLVRSAHVGGLSRDKAETGVMFVTKV
jgi:hypothetical protein